MARKKDPDRLRTQRAMDQIRWESAKELGLTDETRDRAASPGRSGGREATGELKQRLQATEEELVREGARKAALSLKKGPTPKE